MVGVKEGGAASSSSWKLAEGGCHSFPWSGNEERGRKKGQYVDVMSFFSFRLSKTPFISRAKTALPFHQVRCEESRLTVCGFPLAASLYHAYR